ncbi:MAG: SMP-30/gluconolactonase/LRE family protein [Chloroflexi bacterium]|nr:SMP-30/gluconolactonase/LRE family protein [Chloroflexota bacterium]
MAKAPELPATLKPYPVVANIEFAEGPIFDEDGYLYFVNYGKRGMLGRMAPRGLVESWIDTGGVVNGLKYDGNRGLICADHGAKRITRIDIDRKLIEVLTDEFEGNPYLGPNDVCMDLKGNVYFSDPGADSEPAPGAVYRIDMPEPDKTGAVKLVAENLEYPNGLAVHPDQKQLFVCMSRLNSVVSFDIDDAGNASNPQTVFEFPNPTVDGCQFDEHGRLWVARWLNGTMDVIDVEAGKLVRSYPMRGDRVTNLCWWDDSVYVTVAGSHSIERLDAGVRGASITPPKR